MSDPSREDKLAEQRRYDARASRVEMSVGTGSVPLELRSPYGAYDRALRGRIQPGMTVLEIGAGTGEFSGQIVAAGAALYASDISVRSLLALRGRFTGNSRVVPLAADMEKLPFADVSFDVVASAGSLSYGDPDAVLNEIHRVLKRGGVFVCVDSLNCNPVYRLNRWIHFLRGNRSRSTLLRMPDLRSISRYAMRFRSVTVEYFGAISWLMPVARRLLGSHAAAALSDRVDRLVRVRGSAFKFVMTAVKGLDD